MIKIALTNLGKYNEGHLVYEWLDLPATEEEIEETLESIGIDGEEYEEYFITDYETDIEGLEIGEYENLTKLNEFAERMANLDKYEVEILEAIIEATGQDLEEALETLDGDGYSFYADINNEEDLGHYVVDEGLFGAEIPDALKNYIDYEAIGREWAMDGSFVTGGFITVY